MTNKNDPATDEPLEKANVPLTELSAMEFLKEMAARVDMAAADYLTVRFIDNVNQVRIMKMEVVPVAGANSLVH